MARTRYRSGSAPIKLRDLPGAALRAVLAEGYGRGDFKHDVLAGIVVGIVALPLAMALSIAVGAPPQQGLYTAIVAGAIVALLGGSRTQVTGPTAAFIVILAPIYSRFGMAGLLLSGLMGGMILTAMGLLRFGRLIEFIPYPVTTGFTAGIATVIATLQLKDLFGLRLSSTPEHYFDRIGAMFAARGSASVPELVVGLLTLAMLLLLPKATRRVPAPLVALPVAAVLAAVLGHFVPGWTVATIASRFTAEIGGHVYHGIPRLPPLPLLPWLTSGPGGQHLVLDFSLIRALLPGAFAVAMLGAIESLLSAVVADGMARTKHDPDAELLALGIGNLVAPFFGGIPATGAIARTATNIRSGARSPIAATVHALVILVSMAALAPLIGYLPMASLAALLLIVAWNMSDAKHFVHVLKVAPKSDAAVLLTCFGLTVAFDMVVAVTAGILMAALLFMRRMAEVTQTRLSDTAHPALSVPLPKGVLVYDISGPLFFGAAQRAMSTLTSIGTDTLVVIVRMDQVPAMDATGLVALESALDGLANAGLLTIITGLQAQPRRVLAKAGLTDVADRRLIRSDIASAVTEARRFLDRSAPHHPAAPDVPATA